MYTRRAALVTVKSLRQLSKVCRARGPDFPCHVSVLGFVRNLGTATERSDIYSNFDGNIAENHAGCSNYNQNDRFYGGDLGGVQQHQNPSGVYGQSLSGQYGDLKPDFRNDFHGTNAESDFNYNSGNQNGRFYGRNFNGVEQKRIPNRIHGQNFNVQRGNFASGDVGIGPYNEVQHNANFNGYGSGGNLGMPPEDHGGVQQQNSRGLFAGQDNLRSSYGVNEEMSRQTVHNAGMHQQNGGGIYYSNAGNYQQSSAGSRNDGITYSQVPSDMQSNEESVEATGGNQVRSKIEDLDEFTKEGKLKEAVDLLELLQKEGVQVELPRYVALMKACSANQALEEAKSVHEHLLKSMPHLEVRTYNRILEMYSNCGSMEDAFAVFGQMPKRNLTTWDIMISGFAKNGHGEDSVELFEEFKRSGLKPDGQMFLGVFSACGVLCDIVEGMLHFESMTKDYGIVPTMEHYVSMVDMLGSAGCLNEALEFIEKMPVEPGVDIWLTLMKFCRIHGNMELGDRCAELVELLDPSRLNEQSRAGLIPINPSDLAREKEKKKLSGQNLLDVRSRVHEYRAGDRSHPDHERIYALLNGLKQQMKEVGYVPETKFVLHDVDQEVKEEALMAHSERLAAAQGFLTSAARSPLRIIKNLRVCGDCHNAFKIISKIVGREIIARDSKRFHHFRDGSCSCNDYW
ncbi:pentatricopeptide repeat-containing protein At4g32450, mitochondrial [Sesamum indicum]|uniref:Pentatricopeptide repeat-containing protein At4g32450, mitochondrial n=1 Tax=Sesamum indicum TaxID=4182 RepID=A0A8M8UPV9_SESIN|nr:pentatricopeptide repeat-containing protein At4g32450, mitochondrial [Sesamum indicum]